MVHLHHSGLLPVHCPAARTLTAALRAVSVGKFIVAADMHLTFVLHDTLAGLQHSSVGGQVHGASHTVV